MSDNDVVDTCVIELIKLTKRDGSTKAGVMQQLKKRGFTSEIIVKALRKVIHE